MDIVVIGHGYVGSAFAARAVEAGHRVYATKRSWSTPPCAGVMPITYSFGDPRPRGMPAEADRLVFCASAGAQSAAAYEQCYIDGLAAVRALFSRPPARLLFTSSTSVYAQNGGEWVNESALVAPDSFSAQILRAAESSLADYREAVVLRLGGIYGPGRHRLLRQLKARQLKLIGGEPRYTNRIHRDDAAAILLHLLQIDSPDPVYNGVDCEPASHNDVVRWLAQSEGIDPDTLPVIGEGDHPLRSNKRVSNERLLSADYKFIFPTYREGFNSLA